MVFVAGLFRTISTNLYLLGQGLVVAVVYIAVGLTGGEVTQRGLFTTLSLSWSLAVNIFCHFSLAAMDLIESNVATLRMKVSSGPLVDRASEFWPIGRSGR